MWLPERKAIWALYSPISGSVQFSSSVMSGSLQPHRLQYARLPRPSPTLEACSNSCPLSWWCHLSISPSVIPFSSCSQSFQTSESFPMSQFFGQNSGVSASASVFPINIQDWFPLGLNGLIFLQSKELSRVFSNTTVQKLPWVVAARNLTQKKWVLKAASWKLIVEHFLPIYKKMESSLTAMDKYYLSGCLRELNSIWQSGTMKWSYQYSVLLWVKWSEPFVIVSRVSKQLKSGYNAGLPANVAFKDQRN